MLKRYSRNNTVSVNDEINSISYMEKKIKNCTSAPEVMGHEGIAARYYFSALSKLVNPDFKFTGRSKRPPKDAFNSMLSLGYTILLYEIYAELENRGLTPYIGFLHSDKNNHPTLASDLMEEWRAVIVDSTVMSLVQGNEVNIGDFTFDEATGAVYLNNTVMKIFISKIEKKLQTGNKYLTEELNSLRRCLYLQTNAITKAIEEKMPKFTLQ